MALMSNWESKRIQTLVIWAVWAVRRHSLIAVLLLGRGRWRGCSMRIRRGHVVVFRYRESSLDPPARIAVTTTHPNCKTRCQGEVARDKEELLLVLVPGDWGSSGPGSTPWHWRAHWWRLQRVRFPCFQRWDDFEPSRSSSITKRRAQLWYPSVVDKQASGLDWEHVEWSPSWLGL